MVSVWCGLLCSGSLEECCRGKYMRGVKACDGTAAEQGSCVLLVHSELQVWVDLRESCVGGIAGPE